MILDSYAIFFPSLGRCFFPIQLTIMILEIAMIPPTIDNMLGNSCSQNQATTTATTGSAYNMLATEPVSPIERAIAQVT